MSAVTGPDGPSVGEPVELQGHHRRSRSRRVEAARDRSPFVPLLILLLTTVAWSSFQLFQLAGETRQLEASKGGQDAALQQAQRVRQALDTLATETRKLAEGGNANARLILEELRKRGITIGPPAAAPGSK